MDVEFKDLSYSVTEKNWKLKRSEKVILNSVSGLFRPGHLSAILGPSGAGKSSLLNALSGFQTTGLKGTLWTNGSVRDERVFRSRSCYITQDDLLQPYLSLKEVMMFAAKLKLPAGTTNKQRDAMVSDIIHKLGLTTSAHTRTELLSGGQKKRLSIAMELINNPQVFFLDEPTSGLDNVSSKLCLEMLRSLSGHGRTIVCTIHQPSALLFALFDHVYVLAQGRCVYQGTSTGLLRFLDSAGFTCPLNYNPADYVIEVTDGEEVVNVNVLSTAINNGKLIWKEETFSSDITADIIAAVGNGDSYPDAPIYALSSNKDVTALLEFATSPWTQFTTLLARMLLQIMRNRTALWIQFIHHLFCALMITLLFNGSADDGAQWFLNVKCIVGVVVFHSYTWIVVPILNYPFEAKLMKREYFNRWYGFTAYYTALSLSTVPTRTFFSMIFITIVYFSLGLPFEPERFILFSLIGVIVAFTSEGVGYAVGATFSVTNGAAVGPACLAPFIGLAVYGFDFYKTIPPLTRILMQMSFVREGVGALLMASYGLDREDLGCSDPLGFCYFQDPKTLLHMLGAQVENVWWEIPKLCAHFAVFRIMFFVALWNRVKK